MTAVNGALSIRAAKHFGLQNDPRTSIPMGDGKCIIVAHRGGRPVMAIYEEWPNGSATGVYLNFTDRQYEMLYDAIDVHWKAAV